MGAANIGGLAATPEALRSGQGPKLLTDLRPGGSRARREIFHETTGKGKASFGLNGCQETCTILAACCVRVKLDLRSKGIRSKMHLLTSCPSGSEGLYCCSKRIVGGSRCPQMSNKARAFRTGSIILASVLYPSEVSPNISYTKPSMYKWITLDSSSDFAKLASLTLPEYNGARVVKKLAKDMLKAVKAVLIEYQYIDKDYRSTYYNFYAKKGLQYGGDCVRLHFFDNQVTFNQKAFTLRCKKGELDSHYFGYMVLRPTTIATIGRSVRSPDVRRGAAKFIITARQRSRRAQSHRQNQDSRIHCDRVFPVVWRHYGEPRRNHSALARHAS